MDSRLPPFGSKDKGLVARKELDRAWEIVERVSQAADYEGWLEDILCLVDKFDKLADDLIDLDLAQQGEAK